MSYRSSAARVIADAAAPPTPRVRLFTERLLVDRGTPFRPELEEVALAALSLTFDYQLGAPRDGTFESQSGLLLESLGAVDLACLEHVAGAGTRANFVIDTEGDADTICAFGANAVPQLESLGWQVEVDAGYRWHVVRGGQWFADLRAQDDGDDWFSLELGVEHDGQRVDLLPALVALIERASSLRALKRGAKRCVALPLSAGRYLALSPERAEALVDVIYELYGGRPAMGPLRIPASELGCLAGLDRAFGRALSTPPATRQIIERARAAATAPRWSVAPAGLQATLRPYQREGLDWLQHLTRHEVGGILADDMGLGKTLQTIAHLLAERASGRSEGLPSLVVAPTSLTTNWQRELTRFAPSLRVLLLTGSRGRRHARYRDVAAADVVVTSYPVLLRDEERLAAQRFHLLVLDEAQAIKNPRSRVRRAVCELDARHRLCLSGTPIENNLGELWSLFDFLNPGQLGDSARFAQAFRKPIERDGDEAPLRALRRRVGPFILRRTKDEVARELPPKTEIVRSVAIRGAQRDLYESIRVAAHAKVRAAIAEKGIGRSAITILDALMKLRQVCCDPRLVRVRAAADVQASAKLEAAMSLLEHQLRDGRRVLLFSQFTSMLALIGAELEQRGVRALSLTGATPNRQRRIDAFCGGEADVFLISLKAGGTGLNLTSADTVIHYDPWWNPAAQAQATDRAYRIGQTRPVFVYNLIVAGSVEERMLALQQRKRQLAEGIYGAASGGLGEGEVENLLAPLDV